MLLELPGVRDDAARTMASASQEPITAAGNRLIREFSRPVSFLWPSEDVFFSLPNVRRFAAQLPNAQVHLVEDSFAFTPEDQPGRLAELIAAVHAVQA